MLFALPGTYAAGPLPEDAAEVSLLIKEGLGINDAAFLHIVFTGGKGNQRPLNVGLLLKTFAAGWRYGIADILLEVFTDGKDPGLMLLEVPVINELVEEEAKDLFGNFANKKPEFDPFEQPTGLPSGQRSIGTAANDWHEL
jgi:hypothetical protein